MIGIIIFVSRVIIVDVLPSIFGPLILLLLRKDYLVIPLSLIFTLFIIFLLGFLVSRIDLKKLLIKNIEKKQGALYKDDIAAIVKEIEFKKANQEVEKRYVIYRPFTPIPWSGFLSIAKEEEVILLKISYLELYNIVASFGKNVPDVLEELKIQSVD